MTTPPDNTDLDKLRVQIAAMNEGLEQLAKFGRKEGLPVATRPNSTPNAAARSFMEALRQRDAALRAQIEHIGATAELQRQELLAEADKIDYGLSELLLTPGIGQKLMAVASNLRFALAGFGDDDDWRIAVGNAITTIASIIAEPEQPTAEQPDSKPETWRDRPPML